MVTTQDHLGVRKDDQSEVFRGFAEEISRDTSAYCATVTVPETTSRIDLDIADGYALSVSGPPRASSMCTRKLNLDD